MNIIGIIAEYNPFHNGHIYHIDKIKELYPKSIIILVLNGYFTMRGEVSILSKENKTRIALENNVDLVVELPCLFGTNSADIFAYSAVSILNNLKCDGIIFGSESNNIELLTQMARKQKEINLDKKVKLNLKKGVNYPTALNEAMGIDIKSPNDILGIAYIKAIHELKSKMVPLCIKRTSAYHDLASNNHIISASNIRNKIISDESISEYLPLSSLSKISPINYNLLFTLLKYKITTCNDLSIYLTVDEGIEHKILANINKVNSYHDLIESIKSKRYTYNRLNRMFIHILIGITKDDKLNNKCIKYIRVLGFNKKGRKYLNDIKKSLSIPILTKGDNSVSYNYEIKAAIIYDLLTNQNTYKYELKNKPIII